MNLLKTPLQVKCPSCGANPGEECFYIHTPSGKSYTTSTHEYRREAMDAENKRIVRAEMKPKEPS